jgi:hypothetical protein
MFVYTGIHCLQKKTIGQRWQVESTGNGLQPSNQLAIMPVSQQCGQAALQIKIYQIYQNIIYQDSKAN